MVKIRDFADQWGCPPNPHDAAQIWDETLAYLSATSGRHRARRQDSRTIEPYVSDNRWVVDCPECHSSFMVARWNPAGCCLSCGRVFKVRFPADTDAAVAILEARPDPGTRNWHPAKETLADLERENREFGGIGVIPQERPAEPHSHLLVVASGAADQVDDNGRHRLDGLTGVLASQLTGYVVRNDDTAGTAEVELIGQDDKTVAKIRKTIGAK